MFKIGFSVSLDWGARGSEDLPTEASPRSYMTFLVSQNLLAAGSTPDDPYLES